MAQPRVQNLPPDPKSYTFGITTSSASSLPASTRSQNFPRESERVRKVSSEAKMPPNAASKVFAIAELMEMILLNVTATTETHEFQHASSVPEKIEYTRNTAANTLLGIKRTSRAFRDTIDGSPALQRRITQPPSLNWELVFEDLVDGAWEMFIVRLHGWDVEAAWSRATYFKTDRTQGESWRDIVFLGDRDRQTRVDFRKFTLDVQPGETFGEVVERFRAAYSAYRATPLGRKIKRGLKRGYGKLRVRVSQFVHGD